MIGAATAGLEIDLLIGAGCVKKVIAPYVGAELYAPIGHCFRRAAENGEVEVYETTEYLLYSQLDAAARGLGFLPWRGGVGTSIPVLNPDYVPFNDPINGEPYLAVPALHADWAIIHVARPILRKRPAWRREFGDRLLSRAAERVMLTAERIVPNNEIRKNPWATSSPMPTPSSRPVRLTPVREPRVLCRGRGGYPGIRLRLDRVPEGRYGGMERLPG